MTADDIIRANPTWGFKPARIGNMDGLRGIDPSNGCEIWLIFRGDKHVVGEGPWSEAQIFMAQERLLAVSGALQYVSDTVN